MRSTAFSTLLAGIDLPSKCRWSVSICRRHRLALVHFLLDRGGSSPFSIILQEKVPAEWTESEDGDGGGVSSMVSVPSVGLLGLWFLSNPYYTIKKDILAIFFLILKECLCVSL